MARTRDRDDDVDDDDFDDRPSRSSGAMGPLDSTYKNTNIVALILFGLCCRGIAFILSLVAYLTGKEPKAKSNALLVIIVDGIVTAICLAVRIAMNAMGG